MKLYIASFGYRYSDPCFTAVGFTQESVAEAIESAMEYERQELQGYCEGHDDEEDCTYCNPNLVTFGVWPITHVEDVGGLRNAINIIRECRENENGVTFPDCLMI